MTPAPGPPLPARLPRMPLADAVGLPVADAVRIYRDDGFRVRTLAPRRFMTLAYDRNRITLTVEDGLVLTAHQG